MSEIVKFDYEGQHISFEFADGNRMINATEMARPFSKRVNNFLRMEGTKEYILVLESRYADSRNGENAGRTGWYAGTTRLIGSKLSAVFNPERVTGL